MEYVCVSQRFLFFNGNKRYTVEFSYGLYEWFIFNDEESTNSCYIVKEIYKHSVNVNRDKAEDLLLEYLEIMKN